jgi:hypothetical protein
MLNDTLSKIAEIHFAKIILKIPMVDHFVKRDPPLIFFFNQLYRF